jgi:hypothetical protein
MTLPGEQQWIYLEGVEALMAGPAAALSTAYDFSRHRRVLDLGGGIGAWLVALLRRYPMLEGRLFDLPDAAARARQRLAGDPSGQREQARAELSAAIALYRAMEMTFWLPQAEAALAQVEGR